MRPHSDDAESRSSQRRGGCCGKWYQASGDQGTAGGGGGGKGSDLKDQRDDGAGRRGPLRQWAAVLILQYIRTCAREEHFWSRYVSMLWKTRKGCHGYRSLNTTAFLWKKTKKTTTTTSWKKCNYRFQTAVFNFEQHSATHPGFAKYSVRNQINRNKFSLKRFHCCLMWGALLLFAGQSMSSPKHTCRQITSGMDGGPECSLQEGFYNQMSKSAFQPQQPMSTRHF